MAVLYCDECQRTRQECDNDSDGKCVGRIEREYLRDLSIWEQSDEWVSEPPY